MPMDHNFEKFTHVGGRFAAKVSIRRNKTIGLSQGAINRFKLSIGEWGVVLHYDKTSNTIGLKPTQNLSEEGAIPLKIRTVKAADGKTSTIASVAARSFIEYYDIPCKESVSFDASLDSTLGMIIVKIDSLFSRNSEKQIST